MDIEQLKAMLADVMAEIANTPGGEMPAGKPPPRSTALLAALREEFTHSELVNLGGACRIASLPIELLKEGSVHLDS